ncbi:alpha/beta hydrolase [Paraburkholderia nemoris]|uniref:alpha/beta hydrolase n=1 Tax=Paraburkholderia nemoris TaxID=2793076 RepID=UPI00190997EE|nr:alpha/beta hydrolase [Paraburkholderia nemoris]MBK3812339.1 alpha/beta hydrolase [Paraburkholderia aspalathi]
MLYVPPEVLTPGNDVELVVVMHGTGRQFTQYRDAFAPFGRWNRCIVLCPLFPVGVRGDGERSGFKRLIEGDIRYDKVLLDMVTEVGERYGKHFDKFALFGYSGGGQYVNRFAYAHPERLWAASIGAPGNVTVLDDTKDWWLGTGGFERHFGKPFDLATLQRVPVQMVVGRADLETWEITVSEDSPMYMPGINDAGATRPERLRTLKASFEAAGVRVRFDEMANIAHNGMQVVEVVQEFFAQTLRTLRAGG